MESPLFVTPMFSLESNSYAIILYVDQIKKRAKAVENSPLLHALIIEETESTAGLY